VVIFIAFLPSNTERRLGDCPAKHRANLAQQRTNINISHPTNCFIPLNGMPCLEILPSVVFPRALAQIYGMDEWLLCGLRFQADSTAVQMAGAALALNAQTIEGDLPFADAM
jgi:hypothetical protein